MADIPATLKRKEAANLAGLTLEANQWGFALAERRLKVEHPDGAGSTQFASMNELASQAGVYGSQLIGTGPISDVTPVGGSVGDSSSVYAMLQGVHNAGVILQPSTTARNTMQATADVPALSIKNASGGVGNVQEWQSSGGTAFASMNYQGDFTARSLTAFTLALASDATLSGNLNLSGKFISAQSGSDASAAIQLLAAQPTIRMEATGQTTNSKEWDWTISGLTLLGRTRTDALGTGATWLTVTRTGTAISSIALNASTINTSAGDFVGTSGVLDIHTNVGTGLVRLGGGAAAANTLGGFIGLYGNTAGGGAGGFLALSSGQVAGAQVNLQVRDNEQHAFQALDHASAYEIMSFDTRMGARKIMLNDAVVAAMTLAVTSNLSVNTNKFTVAASSGNTVIAGTLGLASDFAINTNKFTVTGASGNTAIAGILTSTATGSDASAAIQLLSAQPTIRMEATGQTTDAKEWDFTVSGLTLLGRTRTDALGTGATWLTVTRSGAAISSINIGNVIFGSSSTDGGLYKLSGGGLVIRGVHGSAYDLMVYNVGATQALIQNPTGTTALELPGSSVTIAGPLIVTSGYVMLPVLASAPGSPLPGMLYYNNVDGHAWVRTAAGGGWVAFG